MADLKTLQGILALVDVVNFTQQANKLGEKFTAQYTAYFQEKIKTTVEKYRFRAVKFLGDAVLFFGTDLDSLLEIMLDLYERDKPQDKFGFISRFRMAAHSGYFQFLVENEQPVDLVSPEGIKVFRMEAYTRTWELVVTHALFQGIKPLITRKHIEAGRMVLNETLKGFDSEEWYPPFYRLRIVPEFTGVSNLLERRQEELEQEVQSIPVFGRIYPPVPMENNFINLSMTGQTGHDREWEPGDGNFKRKPTGLERDKGEWPDHEFERKPGPGAKEIDVPTLYEEHCRGIIIGLPGAGKTTILKHLAYREFKGGETGKDGEKRIILFVPCRGIPFYDEWQIKRYGRDAAAPNRESALEYMTWIFLFGTRSNYDLTPEEWVEFQDAGKMVHQAYRENRLTLLVDALDEAPDSPSKEKIIQLFMLLAAESDPKPGNRFFLTSRPVERLYLEQKEIPVFNVLSLTMEQVRAAARHLLEEDSAIYKKFDQAIWQEEMVVKMAATPITALLVTAYFQAYEKFHHRFPMYDLLLKFILLRVWDSIKEDTFPYKSLDLFFKEIKDPGFLEKEREIRILYDALASLCFDLFYDAADGKIQRDVEEELLMEYFNRFIQEHLYYEKKGDPAVRADQWLKRFHRDHLLLQAGKTRYVFLHSTVMEFLAAYHLVHQIKKNRKELTPLVRKCLPTRDHLELETLPIAGGSDLAHGFAIISALRDMDVPYDREFLYGAACKCLTELEWQITKTLRTVRLEKLMKPVTDLIRQNRGAVDWIYVYLKEIVLTSDKDRLRKNIQRFDALLKLSRDTLFKEYLDYKAFDKGDSELVQLREELLLKMAQKELVEQWLGAPIGEAVENVLQLDYPGYHPEDKNFHYFQAMIGRELQGFLGSPNMRHNDIVLGCAFSPDGKRFVSASEDGTLKLWDVESGKEMLAFTGNKNHVLGCAFSPDGTRLLSASEDKTLKLWDAASGKEMRTLTGNKNHVLGCAFSPDGTRLLSASYDKTLKLWDAESGKEMRTFSGHQAPVLGCAFSPDGKRLLSASADKTLKLWDTVSGQEIRAFTGHQAPVKCCAFSPDGARLLSASDDKTLKLWDAVSGQEMRTFTGHKYPVLGCAFSPDGKRLLSASLDITLKLWDAVSGQEMRTFTGHNHPVWCCAFSPEGKRLLSSSGDKTLKLWDAVSGKEMRALTGHQAPVWCCAFSPDGKRLLSASGDKILKLWDAVSGKEMRTFTGHKSVVNSCAFSPDGKRLLSASFDKTLKLWDAFSGKEMRTFSGHKDTVFSCAFSPDDGKRLLSASADQTLKLWDAVSGQELRTFSRHKDYVICCAFSPEGTRLLSASSDKTFKLWDAVSGKDIRTFTGHQGPVRGCAFSPDGVYLVSASSDQTLKLWEAGTGKLLKSLHLPWIPYYVAVSKDNLVITANQNGTLTLFKFKELMK